MGGVRARRPRRARQPHGDHRRQPARPARGDHARLGLDRFVQPARAFGRHAIAIVGNDEDAIDAACTEAVETTGRPTVVVARTIKGNGARAVENQDKEHGMPVEDPDGAVAELGGVRDIRVEVPKPADDGKPHAFEVGPLELPRCESGEEVATRKAYG